MKIGKGKIMLLLIVLSIGICKVNALELRNGNFVVSNYDSNENGSFFYNNLNFGGNVDKSFTITGGNTVKDYDYISFGLTLQYSHNATINETTTGTDITYNNDNGNLMYYCSRYGNTYQTYADGTQSIISVCEEWKLDINNATLPNESTTIQENTTGNIGYNPNIQFAIYAIYDDNSYSGCNINNTDYGTALVTCQVSNTANTINSIRVRNVGSTYYAGIYGRIGLTAYHTAWKDPTNSNTQAIINNNNQNAQNIQDGINNSDYNGTTEQPDSTDFNSYEQKEQQLEQMATADMTAVNVGLDGNTSNWIWTIINRILNTNPIIMGFYITILSLGVVKLILRR